MKFVLISIASVFVSVQLFAAITEISVCGRHTRSKGHQYILVKKDVLEAGNYLLFAASPISKTKLNKLKHNSVYRITGGFDFAKPADGINLRGVKKVAHCSE